MATEAGVLNETSGHFPAMLVATKRGILSQTMMLSELHRECKVAKQRNVHCKLGSVLACIYLGESDWILECFGMSVN